MDESINSPFRILIVDDDPTLRRLLAEILQAPTRSITVRDGPRAALEFLQHNAVDLAFVDLIMPGMNGEVLADKIKEQYPHAHVIICTGYQGADGTADVHATSVDRVLQKPFKLGEVLQLANSYRTE